jgi:hypothetical protein
LGTHQWPGKLSSSELLPKASDWPFQQENLFKNLVDGVGDISERFTKLPTDYVRLAILTREMPHKGACDSLVESFFIRVQPCLPVIDPASFQYLYNDFWNFFQGTPTTVLIDKISELSTFVPLLLAVLYCGAITANQFLWDSRDLENYNSRHLIEQLKTCAEQSLDACNYQRHPTINSIATLALLRGCSSPQGNAHDDRTFVCLMIHLAQKLGLHQEKTYSSLTTSASEMHRQVWWHVVWLDVQTSICTGLPLWLHHRDVQNIDLSPSLRDMLTSKEISALYADPSEAKRISVLLVLAISRSLSDKFEHNFMSSVEDATNPQQMDFDAASRSMKDLHNKLDHLTRLLPVQGIPQHGLIPAEIALASPDTHEELYSDEAKKPKVLTTMAFIMLEMMKLETKILVRKLFLQPLHEIDLEERGRWDECV